MLHASAEHDYRVCCESRADRLIKSRGCEARLRVCNVADWKNVCSANSALVPEPHHFPPPAHMPFLPRPMEPNGKPLLADFFPLRPQEGFEFMIADRPWGIDDVPDDDSRDLGIALHIGGDVLG